MAYPQVYSSETGQWTSLFEEAVSIDNLDGVVLSNAQEDDLLRYNSACANFVNESLPGIINGKNIAPATITTSGLSTFNSASVIGSATINENLTVGSSLTVNGVLITGTSPSATVTTEQIQDATAPLFDHAFHTNITATYDDANNRILLSASASSASATISTEEIQDVVGPMFAHSNHTNASASYNDSTGQILISVASPVAGSSQTNFYDVVRDYGAVAGEANSATKIQNALNAARDAGSGIVYIPAGTYNIQSTLQIFSGTTLYLTPKTTIFRQFATSPLIANGAFNASYSGYSGQSNIRIIGGIWESRGPAYPIQPAMAMSIGHGTDIIIQDLTISNVGGYHAIEINSSKNVKVQNCRFVGFTDTGNRGYSEAIQIDLAGEGLFGWFGSYDSTHCSDITVSDCYFSSSGTAGTTAWPTGIGTHSFVANQYHKNIKLINNTFEGLTQYAIRTYNNYDGLLIQNNIIKDCFGGITVGPDNDADFTEADGPDMLAYSDNHTSYNITISDNSIDNSGTTGTNGIWIINAQNVNITNNRIKGISRSGNSLADGILCVKIINAIISNNNIEDIGDDGIDVRTQSRNVFIVNNLTTNVSQTSNNFYRHIYLNNDADDCSIIGNRGYRTSANIAAHGLEFTSTCNNLRFFGNYYGSAATTAVDNTSTNSSTSTDNL
jgi:hypothetical protein